MAVNASSRGRFPGPVSLATGIGALIVALMLLQPTALVAAAATIAP